MKRIIRRSSRTLTSAEAEDLEKLAHHIDTHEKEEIIARGRAIRDERSRAVAKLSQILQLLRSERERQGLSLADLQERTGIDRGALSRLENTKDPNPTISTLERYAGALDKELVIKLVDREDANQSRPPTGFEAAHDTAKQTASTAADQARGFDT